MCAADGIAVKRVQMRAVAGKPICIRNALT